MCGALCAHVRVLAWQISCFATLVVLVFFCLLMSTQPSFWGLAKHDELTAAEDEDDTKGVRYDTVRGIERYLCPHDRTLTVEQLERECFRRGFAGGFVDQVWTDTRTPEQVKEEAARRKAAEKKAPPTESTPLKGGGSV